MTIYWSYDAGSEKTEAILIKKMEGFYGNSFEKQT